MAQRVQEETYVVAARVNTEFGGRGNGSTEQEEHVKCVENDGDDWVAREGVAPCRGE